MRYVVEASRKFHVRFMMVYVINQVISAFQAEIPLSHEIVISVIKVGIIFAHGEIQGSVDLVVIQRIIRIGDPNIQASRLLLAHLT